MAGCVKIEESVEPNAEPRKQKPSHDDAENQQKSRVSTDAPERIERELQPSCAGTIGNRPGTHVFNRVTPNYVQLPSALRRR